MQSARPIGYHQMTGRRRLVSAAHLRADSDVSDAPVVVVVVASAVGQLALARCCCWRGRCSLWRREQPPRRTST